MYGEELDFFQKGITSDFWIILLLKKCESDMT